MLAPTPSRPDITADFESLLAAARLEALAILRAHLTADPDTPAHTLRERRLAATAILKIPTSPRAPAKGLPPSEPRAPARGPEQSPLTNTTAPSEPLTPPVTSDLPAQAPPHRPARAPKLKSRKSIYARVQERLASPAAQAALTTPSQTADSSRPDP
jgi:hypothetical protein